MSDEHIRRLERTDPAQAQLERCRRGEHAHVLDDQWTLTCPCGNKLAALWTFDDEADRLRFETREINIWGD